MIHALLLALALPASAATPIDSPKANHLGYDDYAKLHARLLEGANAKKLEDVLPRLNANLKTARAVSDKSWTDCTIFDELAKADILSEKAMKSLGIRRETTGGVVHAPAGVMHTYGYLFSQLQTAFGLKGKRWIESRLDERLGLAAGTFGPVPPSGEFATNLTSTLLELVAKPSKKAAGRVEQNVTWKTRDGKTAKATVFTVLVPLAPLPDLKTTDEFLLIYGLKRDGRTLLTTAFPIAKGFADSIMGTKADAAPVFKPRFNLYVDPSWTVTAQDSAGWRAD